MFVKDCLSAWRVLCSLLFKGFMMQHLRDFLNLVKTFLGASKRFRGHHLKTLKQCVQEFLMLFVIGL